ncbi:hypothetical protein FB45DRAFT_1060644 [Roridomyces roridus]|uniref:Uncharacterized protein n=1 Tax=Roridomyces roridus TaxID=1738132 RepID=A0AAD7FL92_9AGAR|nr:hypothetical protein FB45DRAFT_1060644 [Roridomyces roridus]
MDIAILQKHPELAPNVVKLMSDSLAAARLKINELSSERDILQAVSDTRPSSLIFPLIKNMQHLRSKIAALVNAESALKHKTEEFQRVNSEMAALKHKLTQADTTLASEREKHQREVQQLKQSWVAAQNKNSDYETEVYLLQVEIKCVNRRFRDNVDIHDGALRLCVEEKDRLQAMAERYERTLGLLQTEYLQVASTRDAMGKHFEATSSTDGNLEEQWNAQVFRHHVERETVRFLYHKLLSPFPIPANRPTFSTLEPVYTIPLQQTSVPIFKPDVHTPRPAMNFPLRMQWIAPNQVHALVYHPTHEYTAQCNRWKRPTSLALAVGTEIDLFVNCGPSVFYAGIYTLHRIQDPTCPKELVIPPDVSPEAVARAAGVEGILSPKIRDCFPDGEIKVECFGLQCIGFDEGTVTVTAFGLNAGLSSDHEHDSSRPLVLKLPYSLQVGLAPQILFWQFMALKARRAQCQPLQSHSVDQTRDDWLPEKHCPDSPSTSGRLRKCGTIPYPSSPYLTHWALTTVLATLASLRMWLGNPLLPHAATFDPVPLALFLAPTDRRPAAGGDNLSVRA